VHTAAVAVVAVPVGEVQPEDCKLDKQASMKEEQKVGHRSGSCRTDCCAAEVDTVEDTR